MGSGHAENAPVSGSRGRNKPFAVTAGVAGHPLALCYRRAGVARDVELHRHCNKGTGIVRNNQGRDISDKRPGSADAGEPVILRLPARGAGGGVARCDQYDDEDTGWLDLAGVVICRI